MDIIKKLYLLSMLMLTSCLLEAQEKQYPAIGSKLPSFELRYENNQPLYLENLKGRYFILDFWSIGCLSCITSFPKLDSLQKKFSQQLTILLIAPQDKKRDIRKVFSVYQKKYNLKIRSYFDSVTYNRFVPRSTPHLIWVNKDGIVVAITTTEALNDENVASFTSDKAFPFIDMSYHAKNVKKDFNSRIPLLIDGNGGEDSSYLFRSIFSYWDQSETSAHWPNVAPILQGTSRGMYQATGASVEVLYLLAYFGTLSFGEHSEEIYPFPQLSNSAKEALKKRFNNLQRFNYCIEAPVSRSSRESFMKIMQGDLGKFLGLASRLRKQSVPCYELIISDERIFRRLISSGERTQISWNAEDSKHTFVNAPVKNLTSWFKSKIITDVDYPFYNSISENVKISFTIEAQVNDIDSIRKGLQGLGMDLKPTSRELQVIEITEDHL